MSYTVQSLWVGPELSAMERLSIASFLHHGHAVELFVYGDVDGVPAGTTVRDGREILPASAIFEYRDRKTYAGFSNFFRYKLLLERGGWWVDTDVVCLRPFDFDTPYVFGAEVVADGTRYTSSAALKAPAGSQLMRAAWETCRAQDPSRLKWGGIGPRLVTALVEELDLGTYVEPPETFSPLPPYRWHDALDPDERFDFTARTYAVHLWNEQWRRAPEHDKDRRYPASCLYERLKTRYGVG